MPGARTVEEVVLSESYVLAIRQVGSDIIFDMELVLDDGWAGVGSLVVHHVKSEEWLTAAGMSTSLESLNKTAHRYYGGADEPADLGAINSLELKKGIWTVLGDWGECHLLRRCTT